jgi:uncharacterized protein YegP (UPF0339 family)
MQFVIYQDNCGRFHWSLVGEDGVSVAVSANAFSARGDALRAASQVHLGAGSATGTKS